MRLILLANIGPREYLDTKFPANMFISLSVKEFQSDIVSFLFITMDNYRNDYYINTFYMSKT